MVRLHIAAGALLALAGTYGASAQAPVLARDIDKRPLPRVAAGALPPAVRKVVQDMEAEQHKYFASLSCDAPACLTTTVSRIPVAPHGHALYLVEMAGELGCTGNGPNCRTAVFDETAAGVETVNDNGYTGVAVVRRPALQMPDIAFFEQEGHAATTTVVYRFDGAEWKPYLCKEVLPIFHDPTPKIVADKPCTP